MSILSNKQREIRAWLAFCEQNGSPPYMYPRLNRYLFTTDASPGVALITRLAVLKRAGNRCECCGDGRRPLEMRHLHYDTVGIESPDDLEACCRGCHLEHHLDANGEFWRDAVEMEAHWAPYYDALDKDD